MDTRLAELGKGLIPKPHLYAYHRLQLQHGATLISPKITSFPHSILSEASAYKSNQPNWRAGARRVNNEAVLGYQPMQVSDVH